MKTTNSLRRNGFGDIETRSDRLTLRFGRMPWTSPLRSEGWLRYIFIIPATLDSVTSQIQPKNQQRFLPPWTHRTQTKKTRKTRRIWTPTGAKVCMQCEDLPTNGAIWTCCWTTIMEKSRRMILTRKFEQNIASPSWRMMQIPLTSGANKPLRWENSENRPELIWTVAWSNTVRCLFFACWRRAMFPMPKRTSCRQGSVTSWFESDYRLFSIMLHRVGLLYRALRFKRNGIVDANPPPWPCPHFVLCLFLDSRLLWLCLAAACLPHLL